MNVVEVDVKYLQKNFHKDLTRTAALAGVQSHRRRRFVEDDSISTGRAAWRSKTIVIVAECRRGRREVPL